MLLKCKCGGEQKSLKVKQLHLRNRNQKCDGLELEAACPHCKP